MKFLYDFDFLMRANADVLKLIYVLPTAFLFEFVVFLCFIIEFDFFDLLCLRSIPNSQGNLLLK